MSKKSWYAVKVGRKPGLYQDWYGGAEPQVTGFSGAVFMGFTSKSEAEKFMQTSVRTYSATTPTRQGHYRGSGRPRPPGSNTTNPNNRTSFYYGKTPPWDFPAFIDCIE